MNPILTSNTLSGPRVWKLDVQHPHGSIYLPLSLSFFILGTRQRKGWREVRGLRPFVACTAGRIFYRAQYTAASGETQKVLITTKYPSSHACKRVTPSPPTTGNERTIEIGSCFFLSLKPSPLFNIRGLFKIYWHWNILTFAYDTANWRDYCARFNKLKNS